MFQFNKLLSKIVSERMISEIEDQLGEAKSCFSVE